MEPSRFDDLTKALATATSRRHALKTIAATTLGGILGLAGIGTAFAKPTCKPNGHGCGNNKQCCSGFCDQTTFTCGCPTGQTNCSGTCTNLSSDNNNCGSCGNVCPAGLVCQNGTCSIPCIANGGPCNPIMSDCCSGLLCDTTNRTCVSCIPTGDSGCTNFLDCCDYLTGVSCNGGICEMI